MASTIQLKAVGLTTSPNDLTGSGQGGLNQATNIIIRRDDTVESRRGFKLYGDSFGTSTDRAKQLISYKNRILRHFASTLQFDTQVLNTNDESIFASFAGTISETEPGLRIKTAEGSGNLFITTSEGIKKISAKTANDFSTLSGYITNAGGVKAIDFTAKVKSVLGSQSDFLLADSVVGYRHVWGTRDLNNNLILGTPSNLVTVYNPFLPLIINDFNNLLQQIQNVSTTIPSGSLLNDADYVSSLNVLQIASADDVRTNAIALAAKLDADIVYTSAVSTVSASVPTTTTAQIVFGSSMVTYLAAGDKVILSGFTDVNLTQLNGKIFTVTGTVTSTVNLSLDTGTLTVVGSFADVGGVVTSYNYRNIIQPVAISLIANHDQLQSLQTYIQNIILRLQVELTGVISSTLQNTYLISLDVTNSSTVILDINIPEDINENYFLQIYRSAVTTAVGTDVLSDLSPQDELGLVYEAYPTPAELSANEMIVQDIVLDTFRGANLYTNAITGEGILQANEPPPFAKDIAKFKNVMFFANTRTRQSKIFNFLGVTNFYISKAISAITVGAVTTITAENHGFTSGDSIVIAESNSVPSIDGVWTITSTGANSFTIPYNTVGGTNGTEAEAFKNKNAKIVIANSTVSNTYSFTVGSVENTRIIFDNALVTGASFNTIGTANYFELYAGDDQTAYYAWYSVNGGTMTDPAIANKTGIKIVINTADTASTIAEKTRDVLNTQSDFLATKHTNTNQYVDFITSASGYTTNATLTSMPANITLTVSADGQGEKESTKEILLSTSSSPAIAVEETALSFIKVLNNNSSEIVYGYYLSTASTTPGQINIQARSLSSGPFYILLNGYNTSLTEFGSSFNPAASPSFQISSISVANPTVITTTAPHGLSDGDSVVIVDSNSTPSIDGIYTVSNSTSTTFTIPVNVTIAGSNGYLIPTDDTQIVSSSSDERINRVYFSKLQQYESVPIVNYLDVGDDSKGILRIFPLRDSLFVFKEDGVYRISGEIAPFSLALFDSSTFMIAADSLGVTNNFIYIWTTQGIVQVSESGVSIPPTSRPIDDLILPINNSTHPNFSTATWGIGYDSDNSYLIFTTSEANDTYATICYRYNTLTNSWTTYDKTNTCGVVPTFDDRLYLGAGDTDFLEQERKSFNRTDYADRQFLIELLVNSYLNDGQELKFTSVDNIEIGDVITQDQFVTVYIFNQLLKKLDIDAGINDTDYLALLEAFGGDNIRQKLLDLAAKLDADIGVTNTDYLISISGASGVITGISTGSSSTITLNNKPFTSADVNTATDIITIATHGFTDNQTVTFITTNTLPAGLALNTRYYIINASTNTFQVSLSQGGVAVNLTTGGIGTHRIFKAHDLQTGRIITITGNTTGNPLVNGKYQVTVTNLYQFTIPVTVTTAGTDGNYETVNLDYRDLQACFNTLINKLNADSGVAFNNYAPIEVLTTQETIITDIDNNALTIGVGTILPFVLGNITVYKAIETEYQYEPNHMEDPLGLKHLAEASMMFGDRKFTIATISFSTDLVPYFTEIEFPGAGNGIFGLSMNFGGNIILPQFFGGVGNLAPLRTLIPRDCQRCRFVNVKFRHRVAREHYSILGITLTGLTGLSTRAYR